jgi:hypothetical protein
MNNKYNLAVFLGLTILTVAVVISFGYLFLQKQKLQKSTTTSQEANNPVITPTPLIANFDQQTYTGTVSFEDCGTQNVKSPFTITLPTGWIAKKLDNPDYYQNYNLFGPQGSLHISCFKTFQANTCNTNASLKTIAIGNTTTEGCLQETGTQTTFEFADLKSPQNNIFDFGGNINDKQILNQILTSFRFK